MAAVSETITVRRGRRDVLVSRGVGKEEGNHRKSCLSKQKKAPHFTTRHSTDPEKRQNSSNSKVVVKGNRKISCHFLEKATQ